MKHLGLILPAAVLGLLLPFSGLYAASSTAKFLLINPSPRVAAMGNTSVAVCEDANAVYYIPSAMCYAQELKFAFSYTRWLEGLNHFTTFGVFPLGRAGALGLGVLGLASGDILATSDLGGGLIQPAGSATALDLAFLASYAFPILRHLSTGTTLKVITERLEDENATAFAADLSLTWEDVARHIKVGAIAQNLGTPGKFVSQSFPMPLAFRLGASYDLRLQGRSRAVRNVLFALEGAYKPEEGASLGAGAEVNLIDIFLIRLGYDFRPKNDSTGFKTGLGIRYTRTSVNLTRWTFDFDYGIDLFRSFSPTHFIQVRAAYLNFSDRIPARQRQTLKSADTYMSNVQTYDKASTQYRKVIDSVPAHLRSAYNLSCVAASEGRIEDAVGWMEYILRYDSSAEMRRRFENDSDFDAIRNSKEFRETLAGFDKDR